MIEGRIIIIDTEHGFIERFTKKLEEEGIKEKIEVINLVPKTSLLDNKLIEDCLESLKNIIKLSEEVCGIFVDLVIGDGKGRLKEHDEHYNYLGIKLATAVKAQNPQIPTFGITAYEEKCDMLAFASLENLDGVIMKSVLESETFSYYKFNKIIEKANQKIASIYKKSDDTAGKISVSRIIKTSIDYEYPDPRVKQQITELGENDFLGLLNNIFSDSKGTISYIHPGRSGAYVFKVNTKFYKKDESKTRAKQWVVKICRNTELIDQEVENYKKIQRSSLPKTAFPKMYLDKAFSFGKLKGLAYEFENDSNILIQFLNNSFSNRYIKILKREIYKILFNLYGDADKKIVYLWKNQYCFDNNTKNDLLFFLDNYEGLLTDTVSRDSLSRIKNLIKTQGESEKKIFNFELEIDQRNIHGDFNVGNILINKRNNLVLLDFASFQKQGHIAKDVAKLERDIIYKVVDAFSTDYYDWSRMEIWKNFSELYHSKDFFDIKVTSSVNHEKIKNYILLIKSLRSILISISPEFTIKEYLFSILYYTLLALNHPDISLHKKVYALKNIEQILNQIELI